MMIWGLIGTKIGMQLDEMSVEISGFVEGQFSWHFDLNK